MQGRLNKNTKKMKKEKEVFALRLGRFWTFLSEVLCFDGVFAVLL